MTELTELIYRCMRNEYPFRWTGVIKALGIVGRPVSRAFSPMIFKTSPGCFGVAGVALPPPQALRFQSQAGELEAGEAPDTGDEPTTFAARERCLGTRQGVAGTN